MTNVLNRFKGCLVGGAIGDALGYVVEFMNIEQIRELYGPEGIQTLQLINGKALVSDDTQMTLYTANGLLTGGTRQKLMHEDRPMEVYVHNAYMDWQRTQRFVGAKPGKSATWLVNVPALHSIRAPGGTCLRSLSSGIMGTLEYPINSSKGCGGVMRVSPIGLYYSPKDTPIAEIDRMGAKCAALTHGHQLGFLPAAALTHIINSIVYGDFPEGTELSEIVEECIHAMEREFAQYEKVTVLTGLMRKALLLAEENTEDVAAIAKLGEGWVAEEALTISLYCALKYPNNFEKAIIASANHSGDSDSTASITGNILGALLGYDSIPSSMIDSVELGDVIRTIATDLYLDATEASDAHCLTEDWQRKYVKMDYRV